MVHSVFEKITNFSELIIKDDNHRYKSWEHCYKYFISHPLENDIEKSCLHLSFYLASWGMYRGSSSLLWKDYWVHKEVVVKLIEKRQLQKLDFISVKESQLDEIIDLSEWIKEKYHEIITVVNGEHKEFWASDTLVTKILLGTLGCVPAYDRYFIEGMRESGIKGRSFKADNFKAIVYFYRENIEAFQKAFEYPPMKLIDMYFWEIGYHTDMKKKKNDKNTIKH